MKEKGFTLIELLAVIVILAIIALIAVPIILNIINDTKKSSIEKSKELYLHAVEIAIANKNLNENFNPSICTVIEKGNLNCDVGELKVEVNGQVPKIGGTITLKDWDIISNTLEFEGGVKNDTPKEPIGKAVTESNKTIAGNIPQGNYEPGDEYIINVDGEHEYHFYVLSTDGDKVNLIMSRNICSDGTLATVDNKCTVAWLSSVDFKNLGGIITEEMKENAICRGLGDKCQNNEFGPVTIMNYLYETTKNWDNISNIQMNYIDEGTGYGAITTIGNTTKITKKDGTETAKYENLKARLPKYEEIVNVGCGNEYGSCPTWIVNGLKAESNRYPEGTKEDIDVIEKYWTLRSSGKFLGAIAIYFVGTSNNTPIQVETVSGLRPVIEVSKSELN